MSGRTYTNPIRSGFHPDPSIVRVVDDYYMVNSTFQYFPAIVISHSKDMVHWRYIGHAITSSSYLELNDLPDSYGIWAPDISYYNGYFYICATLRLNGAGRANLMMKSSKPEGPYTKPVVINTEGIDPSHFVDDDGTHYMAYGSKGTKIVELNDECTKVVGEPVLLWEGSGKSAPEGPHILKREDYYYIIMAEGGTEYGHCVTASRSRQLLGPYEPCPFNPVHTQSNPIAAIQRAGHGKLVETQNGEWWMVYLAGRPLDGGFCTLGRETCLDPVHWRADGWFEVNESRGPSEVQRAPSLEESPYHEPMQDEFDTPNLPLHWQFVRNPEVGQWSLEEKPGWVRIWTGEADLSSIGARNVLVRRERHHIYTARMKLEFRPEQNGEQAGLICYYDSRCYIKLCLIYESGPKLQLHENRAREHSFIAGCEVSYKDVVYLRVDVDHAVRKFSYSLDGEEWNLIGTVEDARFLSDEGTQEKKAFTGTMVGFYASNGGSGRRIPADIDWFQYERISD
ncbi:glycoside hydrolase family 43 protein [Paenibacillus lemnae]|uniref:Glycoside hydrolase family 43 protein n=1 Tax=Paenibacillus lemnae TaxID=1330551 RepID=A0A848M614_PAELE|nr:glycoside hydrolase family 43 protein [Paenibacillus lemnae]NMO95542.1 glycoside hydrolase family 43 protein [Paenibacillus lemnae]